MAVSNAPATGTILERLGLRLARNQLEVGIGRMFDLNDVEKTNHLLADDDFVGTFIITP